MAKSKAKPKSNGPSAEKFPKLKAAWDEYGHDIKFEYLDGYKTASHPYIVVRWKERDGSIGLADLSFVQGKWEMQNDGFEPITEEDWKKLYIPDQCDWFVIPGKKGFENL